MTLETPIVNVDGPELILFESGGTDTLAIRRKDGASLVLSANRFSNDAMANMSLSTVITTGYSEINTLAALESATLVSSYTTNQRIYAVLLDLSDLGYDLGEIIQSLAMGTVNTGAEPGADLMALYAFPFARVPEPSAVVLAGIALGGMLFLSIRRTIFTCAARG